MSWFGGSGWKPGNSPSNNKTALQVQRAKQIETLQKHNFGVAELQRDTEYRVAFNSGGFSFTLFITLPPEFPQCRPNVRVTPSGQHPWLSDSGQVVACPALNSFSMQSDLGLAVKSVVEELSKNPPRVGAPSFQPPSVPGNPPRVGAPSFQPPSVPGNPPGVGAPSFQPQQLPYPVQGSPAGAVSSYPVTQPPSAMPPPQAPAHASFPQYAQPTSGYAMPDIPAVFPELRQLSALELQTLMEDESALLQRLGACRLLEALVNDGKSIAASNELLATTNLAREPDVETAKLELMKKHEREQTLRTQLGQLASRQSDLAQCLTADALQDNLKIAASESEETSDKIAEALLTGDVPMDEFLKKFLPLRTVFHSRRIQEEKLQHLISNGT